MLVLTFTFIEHICFQSTTQAFCKGKESLRWKFLRYGWLQIHIMEIFSISWRIVPNGGSLMGGDPVISEKFCFTHLPWAWLREKLTWTFPQAIPMLKVTHQIALSVIPGQKRFHISELYYITLPTASFTKVSVFSFTFLSSVSWYHLFLQTLLTTAVNQ